jgi:hypothetical protein
LDDFDGFGGEVAEQTVEFGENLCQDAHPEAPPTSA